MRPVIALNNMTDRVLSSPQLPSDGCNGLSIGMAYANLPNEIICQPRRWISFTSRLRGIALQVMTTFRRHVIDVVLSSSEEQVIRTNTDAGVASMQYPQTKRDRTEVHRPRQAMDIFSMTTANPNNAVGVRSSVPFLRAKPDPARTKIRAMQGNGTALINLPPESKIDRFGFASHEKAASEIEMVADTTRLRDGHEYSTPRSGISIKPSGVSTSSIAEIGG